MNLETARPASPRRVGLVVALVALVVGICGATIGFAASDESPKQPTLKGAAPLEAKLDAMRRDELRRQLELRSPAAKAARERSEGLFGDLAPADALELGGQVFPGALAGEVFSGLTDLPAGQRVDRYLGELAARLERPNGKKAIVESTVPLRAEDEQGRQAPVDLALEDRGGYLESANPIVPVRFHEDPARGVTLEESGVSVALAGVDADATAVESADRLAIADALTDTDYWAKPIPGGFETFATLRSPQSPERIALDVDVPEGAELREAAGGAAEVVRDGEVVTRVSTPVANDADGQPVEVTMAVDGDQLVLDVAHRGKDLRYPLLVDPAFEEEWDWVNVDSAPNGWEGYTNQNNTFDWTYAELPDRWGDALYVFTRSGSTVSQGNYGGWVFNPRGPASYVYRAEMRASTNAAWSCMIRGINDGYDMKWNCSPVNYNYTTSCVISSCDPGAGGNDNWAYFRLESSNTSVRTEATKAIAALSYAKVFYSDRDAPSYSGNSGGTGTAWAQSVSGTIDGTMTDNSLGMGGVELQIAGHDFIETFTRNYCHGIAHSPCPTTIDADFQFDSSTLTDTKFEGKHSVVVSAWDIMANYTGHHWGNFWIDRSGPAIALSGSLWNGRVIDESTPALSHSSSHNLQISATDGVQGGTPAQRRSGMKSIEVRVDGEVVLAPDSVSCPAATTDSCPHARNYTFSTGEYSAGKHVVQVIATDQVGNKSTETFEVKVPPAGELLQPRADTAVSRWIQFEAHADNPSLTTVKFQYRRPGMGWVDVPQSAMTNAQGQPVTTINHALTGGNSPVINWDVPATWAIIGAQPGPMDVRARFAGGSGPGGSSKVTRVTYDPRGLGTNNSRTSIGPGEVDLVTGNLSVSSNDAAVAGPAQTLGFTRTFNSRDPGANPTGPFGPGWVTSVPVSEAAEYSSLKEYDDAANGDYVEVTATDGGKLYFFPDNDGGYESVAGLEGLTLTKPAADRFKIEDTNGNGSVFVHQAGTPAGHFDLTEVTQPGSANVSKVIYDANGRVTRIAAPSPPGVDCFSQPNSVNNKGCRSLVFTYATATTATGASEAQWGDYAGRLKQIELRGWGSTTIDWSYPALYQYDNTGKLRAKWTHGAGGKTTYSYDAAGRLAQVGPAGLNAWSFAYEPLMGDPDGGRLKTISRATPQGILTSTVLYDIPVSGGGAPYQMGMADVDDWSQEDYPVTATAIFPPDAIPLASEPNYTRATVHYMNRAGRGVNTVTPGGATTTSEYDRYGNVVRSLSPSNHARALASGGLSAQVASTFDTQRTYQDDGQELVEELGPQREVKLDGGNIVSARPRTVTAYDEGAPPDKNPHLPTTVTSSALVLGGTTADSRVTRTYYDWDLRKPTQTIVDYGNLNLTRSTTYDPTTGLPLTATMPKAGSGVRHTTYYKASGSGTCGNKAQWHGLPCQTYISANGLPQNLPGLPTKTFTYDLEFHTVGTTSELDGEQITTSAGYNAAGQVTSTNTSTGGAPPTSGLVAAYGFEDTTAAGAVDSSGNGNNAALQNGALRISWGRFGKGIKFDGVNDRVRAPDAASLDLSSMTLSAWVRPDSLAGTVISRGSTTSGCTGPSYGLRTALSGGWCGSWYSPPGMYQVRPKLWSHVAVTKSGSYLKIYLDGVEVHSVYTTAQTVDDTAELLIGAASNGSYFTGLIDEVRIYNRAQSAGEIADDMRRPVVAGSIHAAAPTSGLRAAWAFEEKASATQLVDASGNGNTGTLSGMTYAGERRIQGGAHGAAVLPLAATVPDSSSLDVTSGVSVTGWWGTDTSLPYAHMYPVSIASKLNSYSLRYTGMISNEIVFTVKVNGVDQTVSAALPDVTWSTAAYHLAGTFDGTTMKLYVNGAQAASLAVTGTVTPSSGAMSIGDYSYPSVIDELRVFDRALTSTEVLQDSNKPLVDPQELPSHGEPVAGTNITYHAQSGLPLTQSSTENGVTRTVTTGYDSVGRVTSYTDADGNVSTTQYDALSRPTQVNDGKGTQTFTYDAVTGRVVQLVDSHAGTFTADYDVEGKLIEETYPNGLVAETTYDESGSPAALAYTKSTNCSSNCVWYDETVKRSISGQWRRRDSSLSDQDFVYDRVGRLSQVFDTAGGSCRVRSYTYDANSNRTSTTNRLPGPNGICAPGGGGPTTSSTYDNADRLTAPGIVYDMWGRITSLPASHSGTADALKTTYYVNDMVRSQTQGSVSKGWLLDPTQRYRATIPSGTTQEIMHYADGSDSPAWTEVKQNGVTTSWERSVAGIGGSLAAVVSNNGSTTTTKLQVSSLRGDVVGTASTDSAATGLQSTFETDEFGVPRTGATTVKYGFKGGKERRTVMPSGVIQMGVRSYVPAMGRFTSVDPVVGGSANDYDYANQDPVNQLDLDGRFALPDVKFYSPKHMIESISNFIVGGVDVTSQGCVEGSIIGWFRSKMPDSPSKFANFLIKGSPLTGCMTGAAKAAVMTTDWYKGAISYVNSKVAYQARCGRNATSNGLAACWIEKKSKGGKPVKTKITNYFDDPIAIPCSWCPLGRV